MSCEGLIAVGVSCMRVPVATSLSLSCACSYGIRGSPALMVPCVVFLRCALATCWLSLSHLGFGVACLTAHCLLTSLCFGLCNGYVILSIVCCLSCFFWITLSPFDDLVLLRLDFVRGWFLPLFSAILILCHVAYGFRRCSHVASVEPSHP